MAKLEIRLPKGNQKIDFELPPNAMRVLNHGGTVDISSIVTPLLKDAFEAGFAAGYGQEECLINPVGEAITLADKKYGGE